MKEKIRIILRDSADLEIYGIIETEMYSKEKVLEIVQNLKNEWFAKDNGQYLMEYLTENLPTGIDIYEAETLEV